MQVTIVGTGAMACLFGARLASVSRITLTGMWAEGIEAIRRSGVAVENSRERTAAQVTAVPWSTAIEPADLVLILVKAWQTKRVAPHLERLLKPEAVALTLQNGLGNLEELGSRTCLGVTYQGAALVGPGRVQPGGAGPTWIAGPQWIVELFQNAGLPAEHAGPQRVESLLWGKLAVNCAINALTAILRDRNGALLRKTDAVELMKLAAGECAAVAMARGVILPFPDAAEQACEVARMTADNRSSMLQDVQRGSPTEVEAINGAVVSWGERLGVPTPVNEVLLRLVRALGR